MKNPQNEKQRNLIACHEAKTEHARRTAKVMELNARLEAARADLAQTEQASVLAAAALVTALRNPLSHAGLGRAITRLWDADARVIECQTQVDVLEEAMATAQATARSTRQRVQETQRAVARARSSSPGASPASWGAKLGGLRSVLINLVGEFTAEVQGMAGGKSGQQLTAEKDI